MNFSTFFQKGLNKTLKLINGTNFSYAGPWITVYPGTVIDSWYVGEFMSADYTISIDLDSSSKEIIKCLVVASPQTAAVTVYGQTYINGNLVNLTATVNNSRVFLTADPVLAPCKLIFSATYYQSLNTVIPA
jgi:hypothetical protein